MAVGAFIFSLVLIYLVVTGKFALMMQVLFGSSGGTRRVNYSAQGNEKPRVNNPLINSSGGFGNNKK